MNYFLPCANFKDSFQVALFLGLGSFLAFLCWLLGWNWWFKADGSWAVSNHHSLYIALSFLTFCSVNSSLHSQFSLLKLLRLLGTTWLFTVYLYYSLETLSMQWAGGSQGSSLLSHRREHCCAARCKAENHYFVHCSLILSYFRTGHSILDRRWSPCMFFYMFIFCL